MPLCEVVYTVKGIAERRVLMGDGEILQGEQRGKDPRRIGADLALISVPVPRYPKPILRLGREIERLAPSFVEFPESSAIVGGTEPPHGGEELGLGHEAMLLPEQAGKKGDPLGVGNDRGGGRRGMRGGGGKGDEETTKKEGGG